MSDEPITLDERIPPELRAIAEHLSRKPLLDWTDKDDRAAARIVRAMEPWRPNQHGMSGSPEYRTWSSMHARCANPNSANYCHYGGRGIRVCAEWSGAPDGFLRFLKDMGLRPAGCSLDRVDVDAGYSAANCRWATASTHKRKKSAASAERLASLTTIARTDPTQKTEAAIAEYTKRREVMEKERAWRAAERAAKQEAAEMREQEAVVTNARILATRLSSYEGILDQIRKEAATITEGESGGGWNGRFYKTMILAEFLSDNIEHRPSLRSFLTSDFFDEEVSVGVYGLHLKGLV